VIELADVVAVGAASLAALLDIRSRRIPNWLTASALLAGIGVNLWLRGTGGLVSALLGILFGGAILLPFYAHRAVAAGDVKLLAALGAAVGPQAVIMVVVYGALAGGVISVVMLARRRRLAMSLFDIVRRPTRMRLSGATAPYGVAIASGVYLSLLLPGLQG
jgi:prepilin peptidase CpaA